MNWDSVLRTWQPSNLRCLALTPGSIPAGFGQGAPATPGARRVKLASM